MQATQQPHSVPPESASAVAPPPPAPAAPVATGTRDPAAAYARRHDQLTREIARAQVIEDRISWARGIAFLGIAAAVWGIYRAALWPGWAVLVGGVFVGLIVVHHQLARQRGRLTQLAAYYQRGRERLAFDWARGNPGQRHRDDAHPYASDLDLFGEGSVFQLLCQAHTPGGEDCLARWLKTPATVEEIRLRQAAVRDLQDRLEMREQLAVLGSDGAIEGLDVARLEAWCRRPVPAWSRAPHYLAAAVTATAALGIVAPILALPATPFLIASLVGALAVLGWAHVRVAPALADIRGRARDLETIAGALRVIEREAFVAPHLVALQQQLRVRGAMPSAAVAQLGRLIATLEWQYNQLFLPIAILLLWPVHFGLALHRWRHRHGAAVLDWLATLGELEALVSLATYAFERPDARFPELVDDSATFEAEQLGHPLLAPAVRVCNDIAFGREPQMFVVSGSNMSGKSTMLRTVGVNTVLGLAGAPVTAARLRLSPVQLAATLHIQDSLLAGRSRFFAEILKLRQILELTRARLPVLFLIDEIFHGTNSQDRQIGGIAFIRRGLLESGAIGLVSTHDQAFSALGESLAPRIQNVHFADFIVDGTIQFDYRLRPGAVQHSNALELMRSVGIDV